MPPPWGPTKTPQTVLFFSHVMGHFVTGSPMAETAGGGANKHHSQPNPQMTRESRLKDDTGMSLDRKFASSHNGAPSFLSFRCGMPSWARTTTTLTLILLLLLRNGALAAPQSKLAGRSGAFAAVFSTRLVQHTFSKSHGGRRSLPTRLYMGQRGKRIKKEVKRQKQLPTPPRIQTPYGPIRFSRPPSTCLKCSGRGLVRCNVCQGRGAVRATGSFKKNAVSLDRVVGSRWTSVEICHGHRHYRVAESKGSPKVRQRVELRMSNCCGADSVEDFWIPLADLKNKSLWRAGWVTLQDIQAADDGPLRDAKRCFRCKGQCVLTCTECEGRGLVGGAAYEPLHE